MDCCQLEENLVRRMVKREDVGGGNEPENRSPDTDTAGAGKRTDTPIPRSRR